MANESTKWLYEQLKSQGYNVGKDVGEFDGLMRTNAQSRQWAYETAKKSGLNVGKDINEFTSLVAPPAPKTAQKPQQQTVAKPVAQPVRQGTSTAQKPKPVAQPTTQRTTAPAPVRPATPTHRTAPATSQAVQQAKPQQGAPVQLQQQPVSVQRAQQQVTKQSTPPVHQVQKQSRTPESNGKYYLMRRGGVDFAVSDEEIKRAGGMKAWAEQNSASGAPIRVYMKSAAWDKKKFSGHVPIESAFDKVQKGYRFSLSTAKSRPQSAANADFNNDVDKIIRNLWGEAERQTKNDIEKASKRAYDDYMAVGGGREAHTIMASDVASGKNVARLRNFDIAKLAQAAVDKITGAGSGNAAGDDHRRAEYRDLYERVYKQIYNFAVNKKAPKSTLDFFLRKVMDANTIAGLTRGLARARAGVDDTDEQMNERVMADYGKKHVVADIAGTVVGMTADPAMLPATAIGGAATAQASNLLGKIILPNVASGIASKAVAGTLDWGIPQLIGSASNFATFNTIKNIEGQVRHGGQIGVSGENMGYSALAVAGEAAHGFLLGTALGVGGKLIGNAGNKLADAALTLGGRAGTLAGIGARSAEFAAGRLYNGTVFAADGWVQGGDWDLWHGVATDFGFHAKSMVMGAASRINSIRPIKNPRTLAERNHNNMSLWERVSKTLASHPTLVPTKEEEAILCEKLKINKDDLWLNGLFEKKESEERVVPLEGPEAEGLETGEYEYVGEGSKLGLDGYEILEKIVSNKEIPETLRAKLYFLATEKQLPPSSIMGSRVTKTEDGRTVVEGMSADGSVVTRRDFKDEKSARSEIEAIHRQAELNTIDIGERYADASTERIAMHDVKREVALKNRLPEQAVVNIYNDYLRGKQMSEGEMAVVKDVQGLSQDIVPRYDSVTSAGIRADVENKYDVDLEKAIGTEPGRRSDKESKAVVEYGERLYSEAYRTIKARNIFSDEMDNMREEAREEQRQAWRMQMDGRLLYGKMRETSEESTPEARAEAESARADIEAINARVVEARGMCEESFGDDAEYWMERVDENPWSLVDDPVLTEGQREAVLYFINSKAAQDGVRSAQADAVEARRAEVENGVRKRTHQERGTIQPAVMKVDDRQVYVVKGDVVMFPDGTTVDHNNSSESVIVCDAATGKYEFASPNDILRIEDEIDPQTELDAAFAEIDAEESALFPPIDLDNLSEEAYDAMWMSEGQTPAQAPDTGTNTAEGTAEATQRTTEAAEGTATEAEEGALWPDWEEYNSAQAPSTETNHGANITGSTENGANHGANITENAVSEHESVPNSDVSVGNVQQESALSRIPVDEQTQEPMFEQAPDHETAWDGLVEAVGGGSKDAAEIAQAQADAISGELRKLTSKPPKLSGSPTQMIAQKKEHQDKIDALQARLDTWNSILGVNNTRMTAERERLNEQRRAEQARLHDEAQTRFEEEQRIKAEKEAEQAAVGTHAVNPKIKEKWDNATKVEGAEDALTLADGSTIRGRYVMTEAGAATASHDVNNAFAPSEGFPIDKNGQSVNDRDYERDMDAQRIVQSIADSYDNRALQTPVIVSRDGVVLSGNNRTMSGDVAARQGTDKAYVDYLREFAGKYGFTPEQVEGMKNPRVVFVPNENLPYDASTFARFNAQEMKSQSKPEAAVKLGKTVPDDVFNGIVNEISRYDRLSEYYTNENAVAQALGALQQAGVINEKQMPEMRTGTAVSAAGRELIENTLLGKVFQSSPDAVRQIIGNGTLKEATVMGLTEIASNRTIGNGYDLSDELAKAVDLVVRAKAALPDVYKEGVPVSPFGRQAGLFDDEFGDSRVTDGVVLMLADALNSGKPSELRKMLAGYNREAQSAASGQMDIFSGAVPTKEEVMNQTKESFRNATPKEQQAIVDAAIADRKRRAELEAEQRAGAETTGEAMVSAESKDQSPVEEALIEEPEVDTTDEERQQAMLDYEGQTDEKVQKNIDFYEELLAEAKENTPWDKDIIEIREGIIRRGKLELERRAEERANAEHAANEPTEAQKKAGNYKKKHIRVDGHEISIENERGSVRRGTDADGKQWETEMKHDYGYIRGTESVDGDHIDVFLSKNPEQGDVFVVDQINEDGSFDEHKVMYGFGSEQEARDAYLSNYEDGWQGLGNITHVSKDEFKKWIQSSKRKTKPFAEYKSVNKAEEPTVSNAYVDEATGETLYDMTLANSEAEFMAGLLAECGDDEIPEPQKKKLITYARRIIRNGKDFHRKRNGSLVEDSVEATIDYIGDKKILNEAVSAIGMGKTIPSQFFFTIIDKEERCGYEIHYHGAKYKGRPDRVIVIKRSYISPKSKAIPETLNDASCSITPTTYTNKKGKTSDVHLVKFNRELTRAEKSALDSFVREPLAEGKKTPRGWYDRKEGGYMMRSEEAARQLGEMISDKTGEAVADAQPLSREEIREEVAPKAETKPKAPRKPASRASIEEVMSEPAEQPKAEQKPAAEGRKLVITDEMKADEDILRDILGIDDSDVSDNVMLRDGDAELTPAQKRKVFAAGVNYALGYIDQGFVKFDDFATAMTKRLGGQIKPWLKSFYEGAKRIPGYEDMEFTSSEDVDRFDVANFDKPTPEMYKRAEMVVAEQEAKKVATQAEKELKEERNQKRKERDEQTTADTVAIAEEAGVVASKASSAAETSKDAKELQHHSEEIDNSLNDIADQLALLGFYEAEQYVNDYNEAYGYMRNAEKKAIKDAARLTRQLIADLGVDADKVRTYATAARNKKFGGAVVHANIAPAGGEVNISLPLNDMRLLNIQVGMKPQDANNQWGHNDNLEVTYIMYRVDKLGGGGRGRNQYADKNVKYGDLLNAISKEVGVHVRREESSLSLRERVWKWLDSKELVKGWNYPWAGDSVAKEFGIPKDEARALVKELKEEWKAQREAEMQELADMAERGESPYTVTPEVEAELAKQGAEKSINGYKIGDEVMYDRNGKGKWEKYKITDFDSNGRPVLDSFGVSFISEVADWKHIKPANGVFGEAERVANKAAEERAKKGTAENERPLSEVMNDFYSDKLFNEDAVGDMSNDDAVDLYIIDVLNPNLSDNSPKNARTNLRNALKKISNKRLDELWEEYRMKPGATNGVTGIERMNNVVFTMIDDERVARMRNSDKPSTPSTNPDIAHIVETLRSGKPAKKPKNPVKAEDKIGDVFEGDKKPEAFGGLFDGLEEVEEAPTVKAPEKRPEQELAGNSAQHQEKETQTASLVNEISHEIAKRVEDLIADPNNAKALTMTDVKRIAAKYSEHSKTSDTDLQELVELAMTQLTRREAMNGITGTAEAQRDAYDKIVNLYRMQPSLNARDSERLMKQQYSTPTPFGYVMGQFVRAGGKIVNSMLEPSAGNGALTITIDPRFIHVNDIDEARLANLRKLGFGKVTAQDALLPFIGEERMDVVMTNPPFGTVAERIYDGIFRITSLEGQMAINALDKMKDDGRAAIVIGGNTSYRKNGSMNPKDAAFFGYLYSHYNVVDVINISGKALYSRNGTGYDVRMILIDGRKTGEFKRVFPPVKAKARAEQVTTFDELYKRVQDDIQQIQQVGNRPADVQRETQPTADGKPSAPVRSGSNSANTGAGQRPGSASNVERTPSRTNSGQSSSENVGSRPSRVDNADGRNAGSSNNVPRPTAEQPRSIGSRSAQNERGGSGSNGRGATPARPDSATKRLAVKPDLNTEKVPYPNQSNNGFTLMSVVPAAQAEVLKKSLSEIGDVDRYLVDELGYSNEDELYSYLAAEQVDSVALAIHQMGKGSAFIIGDMTGVGKGRQGAALIRYAVKQGKVPIYFTQKPTLFTDNYRDLSDIGSGELRPFIIASNPKDANIVDADGNIVHKLPSKKEQERVFNHIMQTGSLPDEYDFVLTTYDQIKNGTCDYEQTENGDWNITARKLPKKSKGFTTSDTNGQMRRDALARLAQGNIAILDESHTVGGDSGCGRFMQMLTGQAGGVTFLSATFAKRADNMPIYAQRTAISEGGIKASELIEAIARGGVTLQEIMSKQLVESGQMIRRERSFEGVTIDWLPVDEDINVKQREQFDEVADIFNGIRSFQNEFVKPIVDKMNDDAAEVGATVGITQGTEALGVKNTPFASKMYNLVNQLLFALKVDAVADRVVENLRNGYKPVISFTNTMEGFLKEASKDVEMDEVPNFSVTLMRALDGVLRFTEKDADENTAGSSISLDRLSDEGLNAYNALKEKIMNLSADLPISPMDAIRMKIEEAGYSVAEITGRTMQLNRTKNGKYIVEARKDRDKKAAMRDFNSGKLDVLMINKSGSTGISLHASSKFEDQRQRVMVFAQFQSDINDEVQMRGRIDRSGQVMRGRYEYIMSTIPAEQRIQMMFKAKLKSLDANTTSSQKSKFNEMEIVDYLNKYGDEVVWEYMKDHPELAERLGDPLKMLKEDEEDEAPRIADKEDTSTKQGCAGKISRYLAFLSVDEQDKIFNEITDNYRVKIQLLDDAGENDLEITTMPLRADSKRRQIWHRGAAPDSGNAFADNTYVEEVEVDVLKKPMTRKEIADATRKYMGELYTEKNGEADWAHYAEAKNAEVKQFYQAKVDDAMSKMQKSAEAKIAKEHEKAVKKAMKERSIGNNNFSDEEIQSLANAVADEVRMKEIAKQNKRREEILKSWRHIGALLQRLRAGNIYVVPTDIKNATPEMFSQTFGTFVGFKFNKDFTLGSSTAIFATLDGRRKVELALNQQGLLTIIKSTEIAQRYSPKEIGAIKMDNWDSHVPTQTREKRYIITGNLLQALVDTDKGEKTKGNLISYSTIDGETRQGILMGENFKLTDLRNSAKLSSRLSQIQEGKAVVSENGDVTIERVAYGWPRGSYELRVPKSKQRGGIYTMNKELLKFIDGHNFVTKGNHMVGNVTPDNIARVVDMLSREPFNLTVLEESQLTDVDKPEATGDMMMRTLEENEADNIALEKLGPDELVTVVRNVQLLPSMVDIASPMAAKDLNTGEYRVIAPRKWNGSYSDLKLTEEQQRMYDELAENGYVMVNGRKQKWFAISPERYFEARATKEPALMFKLDKGVDGVVPASENPYDHAKIYNTLNLQFATAYKRPNLMMAEAVMPKSELAKMMSNDEIAKGAYHAPFAKNSVGIVSWSDGSKLALSRWSKIIRVLPNKEVAERIDKLWKENPSQSPNQSKDARDPYNYTPQVLGYLKEMGWEFDADKERELNNRTPEEIEASYQGMPYVTDEDIAKVNKRYADPRYSEMFGKDSRGVIREAELNTMEDKVNEIAEKLGDTKVTIYRNREEAIAAGMSNREASGKGSYRISTGEISVILDNNANVEDVGNTIVHESLGHDGIRILFPTEDLLNNALDELYDVSNKAIRAEIDAEAEKYRQAEAERLMRDKGFNAEFEAVVKEHGDMAGAKAAYAHAKAAKSARRKATEEYGARVAGKVGDEGFEKMTRDEQTFWGKLKSLLEQALDNLIRGLKIPKMRKWNDKQWAYVYHKAWKAKRAGAKRTPLDIAEDVVMRENWFKSLFGKKKKSETELEYGQNDVTLQHGNKSEQNNGVSSMAGRADAGRRMAVDATRRMAVNRGRSDIRMYEEGLGTSHNEYSEYSERNRREAESERLVEIAKANGQYKSRSDLASLGQKYPKGTGESDVYINRPSGRVYKSKDPYAKSPMKGGVQPEDVIYEHIVHNMYFPETEYRFEGVSDELGDVRIVLSQGYVESVGAPSKKQIDASLAQRGLYPVDNYTYGNDEITVTDVTGDNAVIGADGEVYFIDPIINFRKPIKEILDVDNDVMQRPGDDVMTKDPVLARALYEQRVATSSYQVREAMQDSMLGLLEAYKAIEKASGRKRYIEDIAGPENAYLWENRLSSKNKAEQDAYQKLVIKPMLDEVAKLAPNDRERERLTRYMMAKHGLERNIVMRDKAIADGMDPAEAAEKDFAGLTGLAADAFGMSVDTATAEAWAEKEVSDYEFDNETDALWTAVNGATKATLSKLKEGGLLSQDTHDNIASMYENYIPLRGWAETTADEVYGYLSRNDGSVRGNVLKKAYGRTSIADDPIATITMMGEQAIAQANRNKMKQSFFNYVRRNPSDLVSVNRLWLKYDDASNEWLPAIPDGPREILEDDDADTVARKWAEHEQHMEGLANAEPDKYKRGRQARGIPFKMGTGVLSEHTVLVKCGDDTYVITINGNPRAAQALNGLTNPDVGTGVGAALFGLGEKMNHFIAPIYTTRNPDFMVGNFLRDALYTNTMTWVKESPKYAAKFNANFVRINPIGIGRLVTLYNGNKLDMSNSLHRHFRDFMLNGGETGYTNQRDIEKHKKQVKKMLKRANGKLTFGRVMDILGEKWDMLNSSAENCARFSAYLTSREMGRSIDRSIYDAKEVSVNFNKKGSGATFMGATGQTLAGNTAAFTSGTGRGLYVFWNAVVQASTNFFRNAKRNPIKFSGAMSAMFALGILQAILGAHDDDENDGEDDRNNYFNQPDYVRRSNILFRVGDQYLAHPLPHEYLTVFGAGELAATAMMGREEMNGYELVGELAHLMSEFSPVKMEGAGPKHSFIPSSVKPLVEASMNESWTGLPIYKENPFNEGMPEWTKAYPSANHQLVNLAESLNRGTGGDNYTKGRIDFNPAKVEYMLNGYFGGYFKMVDKTAKVAETMTGDREFEWRNMPLVNRVVKQGDERTAGRSVNNDFYEFSNEYEDVKRRIRSYEGETDKGVMQYAERLAKLSQTPEFRRYWIMDGYQQDLNAIRKDMKEAATTEELEALEKEQLNLRREIVRKLKGERPVEPFDTAGITQTQRYYKSMAR